MCPPVLKGEVGEVGVEVKRSLAFLAEFNGVLTGVDGVSKQHQLVVKAEQVFLVDLKVS